MRACVNTYRRVSFASDRVGSHRVLRESRSRAGATARSQLVGRRQLVRAARHCRRALCIAAAASTLWRASGYLSPIRE
jgi:hypothetical protein